MALIAAVNALRAEHGLPPYSVNPTLMQIAQEHSDYMAASGQVTHVGANCSRPYQRALMAGYPVAGDLSQNGFFAENIMAGPGLSVDDVVLAWQGDEPHLNTMLSEYRNEVGAGVTDVGGYLYFTLDTGLQRSSMPEFTPPSCSGTDYGGSGGLPGEPGPIVITLVPNTPNARGAVVHEVKPGETLWLIAVSYGVKVVDLRALNGLPEGSNDIYPGQKFIIKMVATPTATVPVTTTATTAPSATLQPVDTAMAVQAPAVTRTAPVSTPLPNLAPSAGAPASLVVGGIVLLALAAAAALTVLGGRK